MNHPEAGLASGSVWFNASLVFVFSISGAINAIRFNEIERLVLCGSRLRGIAKANRGNATGDFY